MMYKLVDIPKPLLSNGNGSLKICKNVFIEAMFNLSSIFMHHSFLFRREDSVDICIISE